MTAQTDDSLLEITRLFDAPPDRVFAAWLNREEWQAWIGPEGVDCEVPLMEPHVGGRYRLIMTMSDGRVLPVSGVFQTIEAPHRLAFTWGWEDDDNRQSRVTVSFTERAGKTEMTLRHEGLGSAENRDAHGRGWNGTLNKLTAYLAR